MAILNILWNLAAFIVALGILITVHEFGHFWVARRCGVHVERFSVGFGKTLWCRRDNKGTEYVIALIPLGGFVKMLDERVTPVLPEQRHQAFNNKTVMQRALIIAAGPLANFVLTLFIYWLVFMHGIPSVRPIVGDIIKGSPAAEAQLLPGMELKSIGDIETPDWDTVRMVLMDKMGNKETTLHVVPSGSEQPIEKTICLRCLQYSLDKQDPVMAIGILPRLPKAEPILAEVLPDSAAFKADLRPGDKIIKVNGQLLKVWQNFVNQVRDNPGKVITLDIERGDKIHTVKLLVETKPDNHAEGFVGVVPRVLPQSIDYTTVRQYGPLSAINEAMAKTWQLMKLTVSMLSKLLTGEVKLNNLSGPVSIAQGAGISAGYGLVYYLMFLALISVNLGIINLLPLPVLDGGHLLFLIIEKIKGTPVSERVQDFSYRIGSLMLVLLMGLALFNDFSRL